MTAGEQRLISILTSRQDALKLSDTKFAVLIGTSQGNWWRLKRGKRGIGKAVAQGIMLRYPDLWREIQDALLTRREDAA